MTELNSLRLGDSLELLIDNRGRNPIFSASGVPTVTAMSISGGLLNLTGSRFVERSTWQEWMPRPTRRGDVLLTTEAPLGRSALVSSDAPLLPTQRVICLRGKSNVLDSRFLYYAFSTEQVQSDLRGRATGTTVVGIRQSALLDVKITAPPIGAQKAIAEVLSALDDKIAANLATADTVTKLLTAHADNLGLDETRAVDVTSTLEDLFILNPAISAPIEAEPVYLSMQDLPTSDMTVSKWDRRPTRGGARFQNGDTLLARITPCLENRKTAFVDFLPGQTIGVGSTEYIVVRAQPGIPASLSYFVATSERFRDFAIQRMVGTSGRQRVSAKDLAEYKIGRPGVDALKSFGALAEPLLNAMAMLRDERRTLAELRDTLLPHLMSGRLRVKDAEKQVEAVL